MCSKEAPPDRTRGQHACAVGVRAVRGLAGPNRVAGRRGDGGRWPQVGALLAGVVVSHHAAGSLQRPRRPQCREPDRLYRASGDRFRPDVPRCRQARVGTPARPAAVVNLASGPWNTWGRPLGSPPKGWYARTVLMSWRTSRSGTRRTVRAVLCLRSGAALVPVQVAPRVLARRRPAALRMHALVEACSVHVCLLAHRYGTCGRAKLPLTRNRSFLLGT